MYNFHSAAHKKGKSSMFKQQPGEAATIELSNPHLDDWSLANPPQGAHTPMHRGTVYLSGPIIGQTYDAARYGWRKYVSDRLAAGINVLSPMRHEGHLREIGIINDNNLPDHFFSKSKIIVEKDKLDIKRSDIVLVNFLGAPLISKGSLVELGMAYAYDKTIIVAMEISGNLHDHFFVREPALVLNNLDQCVEAVNSLLSEGV